MLNGQDFWERMVVSVSRINSDTVGISAGTSKLLAFALVPLHIFIVVAGLLCSTRVKYGFRKGLTPKSYRLSKNSIAVIMDNYAKFVLFASSYSTYTNAPNTVNW